MNFAARIGLILTQVGAAVALGMSLYHHAQDGWYTIGCAAGLALCLWNIYRMTEIIIWYWRDDRRSRQWLEELRKEREGR